MLRRAEPCEGVVSVAKARPGLASVQTEEAAIDGVITDGSGYCLKITTQTPIWNLKAIKGKCTPHFSKVT